MNILSFKMLNLGVCLYGLIFLPITIYGQGERCSCDLPDSDYSTGINLIYYKCNDNNETIDFPITTPENLVDNLDGNKRTIIYIFDFLQNPQDENVTMMMHVLCFGNEDNVVLLDWSKYTDPFEPETYLHAEKAGRLFADSIKLLYNVGFNVSNLYIIGSGLGAHIAGFAGKCNSFTIPRITGLDPANELFDPEGCYLAPTDAEWIDIIHTDMDKYGTSSSSMGTADYYANGGVRPQPGCSNSAPMLSEEDICSHRKAVEIYGKSKFYLIYAVQCPSYQHYVKNNCSDVYTNVGYYASNVNGTFYFETN